MLYQITKTLPMLLLLAVFTFVYSCNDSVEPTQTLETELIEEQVFETLMAEMATREKKSNITEVDQIDGKTPADFYRQWQLNSNDRTSITCSTPPNCPDTTINSIFSFNASCDFAISYDLYNCGSGNIAIFNFQMAPVVGSNCFAYDMLVTQNYNSGDLDEYQKFYNIFASIILSDIEDELFPFSGVAQSLIGSYIPNLCSIVCHSNGAEEQCGEDCCIRFAVYQRATQTRTTSVFSFYECGGTTATCDSTGVVGDCVNHNCNSLDLYR